MAGAVPCAAPFGFSTRPAILSFLPSQTAAHHLSGTRHHCRTVSCYHTVPCLLSHAMHHAVKHEIRTVLDSYAATAASECGRATTAQIHLVRDAMKYACAGGKMMRGRLVLDVAASLTGTAAESRADVLRRRPRAASSRNALGLAAVLEMVHGASLVADDLPVFDDDTMRRGKPSVHAKFGVPAAMLCSALLLSASFRRLADLEVPDSQRGHVTARVDAALLRAAAGQLEEAEAALHSSSSSSKARAPTAGEKQAWCTQVARAKTGALFSLAFTAGAAAAGTTEKRALDSLSQAGFLFGQLWQIADDVQDLAQDGKLAQHSNSVLHLGSAAVFRTCVDLQQRLALLCRRNGVWSPLLRLQVGRLLEAILKAPDVVVPSQ